MEDHEKIYTPPGEPPGGILIWIIICIELLTYSIAIAFFVISHNSDPSGFKSEATFLNKELATINTILLITSGFLMAQTNYALNKRQTQKATTLLFSTIFLGLTFIFIKLSEYKHLIIQNKQIGTSTFMDFYWSLTAFHLIHIVVGVVLLISIYLMHRKDLNPGAIANYQAGAAFWHLCDLIWILIFPVLYLNN